MHRGAPLPRTGLRTDPPRALSVVPDLIGEHGGDDGGEDAEGDEEIH